MSPREPKKEKSMVEKLPPVPDNDDMASSVSFNTSFLYDQFDNMDSISQAGPNDDDSGAGPTAGLDLKNVGAELSKRDKRITELVHDSKKAKNLLKKAKSIIDSINQKYKASQDRVQSME